MSELKRYDITFGDDETEADMVVAEDGEYVRFEDVNATVHPLVDALELLAGTVYTGMHPPFHVRIAQEALAAYRKAMVVEGDEEEDFDPDELSSLDGHPAEFGDR